MLELILSTQQARAETDDEHETATALVAAYERRYTVQDKDLESFQTRLDA